MNHYDEHTIAQFLLNPSPQDAERALFLEHIRVCFSCREMYEELNTFYGALHEQRKLLPGSREQGAHDLIRSWREGRVAVAGSRTWKDRTATVFRVVRERPVIAVGISSLSIALLLFVLLSRPKITDANPAHAITDDDAKALEVYNGSNQKLWEEHWTSQERYRETEVAAHLSMSTVVDIDGDGRNEVVTVLPFGNSTTQQEWATLRVFGSDSKLLLRQPLGHDAHYKGQAIESTFTASMLAIGRNSPDGKPTLLIALKNRHSASVLLRLDHQGNVLGEYWHYGHFESFYATDLHENRRQELILCGINDEMEHGVVIVVDPAKIVGLTEATATPGFGYRPSLAEEYYVELPMSVFEKDRIARGRASYVYADNQHSLSIAYGYGHNSSMLDYIFSREMVIQQINASDDARVRFDEYVAKGNARNISLDSTLHVLSKSIRYWTGSQWASVPMTVDHSSVTSSSQ